MKTTNKLIMGLLLVSITLLNSCKKGDDGIDGKDGNANVTSVTLTATSWAWDGVNYWRHADFSGVSILTSDVCSTGAVMVYFTDGSGNYIPLPISLNLTSTVQQHWFFAYLTNKISIFYENSNLSDPNPPPTSFKLVCIPQKSMMANPNLDLKNYNEVKKVFNLKD